MTKFITKPGSTYFRLCPIGSNRIEVGELLRILAYYDNALCTEKFFLRGPPAASIVFHGNQFLNI